MRRLHWCLIILLGACSPYPFSKEVGDFSTGVDQLTDAFNSGYTNLAADSAAMTRQAQIDARTPIVVPQSCSRPANDDPLGKEPCLLLAPDQKAPDPGPVLRTRAETTPKLKIFSNYAHGLAAVANAKDRADYDAAAARLGTQVGKLAAAFGPEAGTVAPAAFNLFTWLVGTGLDEQRFETLRRVVSAAQEPVRRAGGALRSGLVMIENERIKVLNRSTEKLAAPLSPRLSHAEYRERFEQTEAARVRLDAIRKANAPDAAKDMITAHDKLVTAVNDPKAELAQVIDAIEAFATHAEAVRDALGTPAK